MNRKVSCAVLIASLASLAVQAQTITKCQDKDGNWHYGDYASQACAQDSTITEIDQRGMTVKKSDAPPTKKELEEREAEVKKQREEAAERAKQEAEDKRLLRTYDNAQSILDARDERVNAMDRKLESQRLFRQDLVDERDKLKDSEQNHEHIQSLDQQIAQYDKAIETIQSERQATIEDYDEQLKRYHELTKQ
ncbi:MAG TPA: DUF4124 domain-containing protein [Candidatus Krumholzibacteria bacterium]|nr:DUF4124 domain-containing protein [Candidatus Krumholzibacteria bacterium]